MSKNSPSIAVIIGNRDFFPDQLVTEARQDVIVLFQKAGIQPVMLGESDTKLGGVETHAEARKCAELFKRHRDAIAGVLVVLPNFGDEKGIADTLKLSGLDVPILIQGYPDDLDRLDVARRRDAFCGKISVCNNLVQAGLPFSLTSKHVSHLTSDEFQSDFTRFLVCAAWWAGCVACGSVRWVPAQVRSTRSGTARSYSSAYGVSVTTVDLSEFLAAAGKLAADDPAVTAKLDEIQAYAPSPDVPPEKLTQMARLGVVLARWMDENAIDATAIQCWTSVQQNFGCNVCTLMSMMSERFMPSACEVDVTGVLTMYAMQLASSSPAAIVDWNNNYGDDDDRCTLFHCGNWAKSFLPDIKIANAPILGSTLGVENTYGALEGRTPAGRLTYGRLTTADSQGCIRAYVGEGELTADELNTFGTRAVAKVPKLQQLMQYVCKQGFEHHVVMTQSHTAGILKEAFETYLNIDTYLHV